MAIIVTITKNDSKEAIEGKLKTLGGSEKTSTGFNAGKFTGKIKSLGSDGLEFQKKLRDEWS